MLTASIASWYVLDAEYNKEDMDWDLKEFKGINRNKDDFKFKRK